MNKRRKERDMTTKPLNDCFSGKSDWIVFVKSYRCFNEEIVLPDNKLGILFLF